MRPLLETEVDRLAPIDRRNQGNERALLLLHGFSSSPAVYRAIWPALSNYNALVCPALPGHAESLEAFSKATYREWIAAAEAACEPLVEQYKVVEVVGLSLGGLLACHLARQFPIQHLYLLAPALKLRFNIKLAGIAAHVLNACGIQYIKNRAGNLFTHEHEELAYKKIPLKTLTELFSFIENPNFTLPKCPIDLFLGTHDDVVDSPHVMQLFEASHHCNVHWLDRSAHAIPLDGDTDTIINCINNK